MNSLVFNILGIFIVLIFDLITIAARSGLRYSNLARILQFREQRNVDIDKTLSVMNSMPRPYAGLNYFQSILRFLLVGLILFVFPWGQDTWSTITIFIVLILVGLIVAWSEWASERFVSRDPELWAFRLTNFVRVVTFIFYPFVLISLWLSQDDSSPQETIGTFTEDELKILVDAGQQEGILEQEERQMIFSVFQLGDTLTREIMVPRIEMLALDIETPMPDAVDALLESGYSRVPVYKGRVDNVIGMLYGKDLLSVWREGNDNEVGIRSSLREPYFVPEAKKVDELLAEMQNLHVHMAVVVDEYGGVAGVVTMEDIVEEIFGEIQDEYDEEEQPYQIVDEGDYLFRGRIDIDDFNEIMESELPREEADTLSGFIYGRLGHVPVAGESVHVEDLNLIVDQVSNRRIRKVRAKRLESGKKQHAD
jgi:CBS domain containing-hemolysin-like protein